MYLRDVLGIPVWVIGYFHPRVTGWILTIPLRQDDGNIVPHLDGCGLSQALGDRLEGFTRIG